MAPILKESVGSCTTTQATKKYPYEYDTPGYILLP